MLLFTHMFLFITIWIHLIHHNHMHCTKLISESYSRSYPITVLQHALLFMLQLDLMIFYTTSTSLSSIQVLLLCLLAMRDRSVIRGKTNNEIDLPFQHPPSPHNPLICYQRWWWLHCHYAKRLHVSNRMGQVLAQRAFWHPLHSPCQYPVQRCLGHLYLGRGNGQGGK